MGYAPDPRRDEAEAIPIEDAALTLDILSGLKRMGVEYTGPCPQCGGNDRFSINTRKGLFLCRQCNGKGGSVALVMFVRGCTFPQALEWMCGPRREIPVEEMRAREAKAIVNKDRKDREVAAFRDKAVAQARVIWKETRHTDETSLVRDYLARRGLSRGLLPVIPASIRFHPSLSYMVQTDKGWVAAHRGPAMVACIQGPDGQGAGVHRTWIDPEQPKGKARILHPVTGEPMGVKKTWGSKKGGAIRLSPPGAQSEVMVMGEGIETTLTALVANVWPGAVYWCGVDMGNMSGSRETGPGLKYAGLPRMDDADAFVPPPWVKRLIFVMDGDSDPRETRAKMEAGLRRAMLLRPGLVGQIAAAPRGRDLNDVLMDEGVPDE